MRKVPSRNQRSKGIKAKHVLQICVLLGVCIWLIYQVKYSHDKKKEFEEKDLKLSKISQGEDGNIKLGRKDLRNEHKVSKNKRDEEEEEEEEADETVIEEESARGDEETKHDDELEVEGNTKKHEEDEQEEEEVEEEENKDAEKDGDGVEKETSKHDEDEDEQEEEKENKHGEEDDDEREAEDDDAQNGGNEGIDEHDQGKTGETGQEDEFIDEGKDKEEKEDEEEEESESNGQSESKENHEEVGRTTHEAREENYKADDASSAVSHEDEPTNSESEKASLDNSDRDLDKVGTFLANASESNNAEGKTQSGISARITSNEEKDQGNSSLVSDFKSIREFGGHRDARTIIEVKAERIYNSTVNLEISGSDNNGTRGILDDISVAQNRTEVAQTPVDAAPNPGVAKPNVTIPANTKTSDILTGQSSNMSSYSVSSLPDEIKIINSTAEAGENPESSSKNDNIQNLESSSHSSTNQTMDTVENDPIDASDNLISHEVKALTDPDTLPDIKTRDDIAAE